jgi:hypothetical protein
MNSRPSRPKKGARLGTQMRGALQDVYDLRGSQAAHLFHTYSLKLRKDVVVVGKLCFLNYLLLESDPNVLAVNYNPSLPGLEGSGDAQVQAEALTYGGVLRLIAVGREGCAQSSQQQASGNLILERYRQIHSSPLGRYQGLRFELRTDRDLIRGNEVRLRNWHRLLPWYAQAQYHSLGHARRLLESRMASRGSLTSLEVLETADAHAPPALLMAAAIEAVAWGRCESNLNELPFGSRTSFNRSERQ